MGRAEIILGNLEDGANVYDDVKDHIGHEKKIFKKTPLEWNAYFSIEIPEEPTPQELIKVAAKLGNRYQDASFYLACSEINFEAIKSGRVNYFSEKFAELVNDFKTENPENKLPAEGTLKCLTENELKDITSSVSYAHAVVRFWKNIVDGLHTTRKMLENMTWNLSIEQKMSPDLHMPNNLKNDR